MNIYLLRHGIALAANDLDNMPDSERPLTAKGIKRMRQAARGLRRMAIPFDAVLTSPLKRAHQTAEIVARALGLESHLEHLSALAPENSVDNLIFDLTRFQSHEHLLLVGHQPLLGEMASFLLKSPASPNFVLKKGGMCRIEIDTVPPATAGTLHWLLAPKQLRLIGERAGKI